MLANSRYHRHCSKIVGILFYSVITSQNQESVDRMLRHTRKMNNGHCPEIEGFMLDPTLNMALWHFGLGKRHVFSVSHEIVIIS